MTRTIQDINYFREFDKFLENENDEYLKERLDNFGYDDYRSWFNDYKYDDIVIVVDQWLIDGSTEHWHLINN